MKIKIKRVKTKQIVVLNGIRLWFSGRAASEFNTWAGELEKRAARAKDWNTLEAREKSRGPKAILWNPITLWCQNPKVTESRFTAVGAIHLARNQGFVQTS